MPDIPAINIFLLGAQAKPPLKKRSKLVEALRQQRLEDIQLQQLQQLKELSAKTDNLPVSGHEGGG
jgi:hypothetical protein